MDLHWLFIYKFLKTGTHHWILYKVPENGKQYWLLYKFLKNSKWQTMLCFFIQSSQDNKIYRLFIYNSLKYANNTGFYTKFSNMQTILVFIQCSQICKKYCFCTKFSRITKYTSHFYTKLSKIANHTAYYSNLSKKQNRITRDKVCQLPSQSQWFSHASSTSKTDYCDLTEIC